LYLVSEHRLERIEPGAVMDECAWKDLLRQAGEAGDNMHLENIRLRAGAKQAGAIISRMQHERDEAKQEAADWKRSSEHWQNAALASQYGAKVLEAQVATLTRERDEARRERDDTGNYASARITELKAERDDAIISRNDAQGSNGALRSHISKLMSRLAAYKRMAGALVSCPVSHVEVVDLTIGPLALVPQGAVDQAVALLKTEVVG
jgi:hypothetical protein